MKPNVFSDNRVVVVFVFFPFGKEWRDGEFVCKGTLSCSSPNVSTDSDLGLAASSGVPRLMTCPVSGGESQDTMVLPFSTPDQGEKYPKYHYYYYY